MSVPEWPRAAPRCRRPSGTQDVAPADLEKVRAAQVRGATALMLFTSSVALIALTASLSPRTAPAERLARSQSGSLRPDFHQLYSTNALGHAPYDEESYLPDIVEPVVPDLHDLLKAQLIGRVSHAEKALKNATVLEAEHAAHMAELKRQLDVERERSAQLVDSAVKGVQDSYGTISSDNEWKGAGRWTPPEVQVKTDVYEWPVAPGMHDDDLQLFARAPPKQMLVQRGLAGVGVVARLPGLERRVSQDPVPVLLVEE